MIKKLERTQRKITRIITKPFQKKPKRKPHIPTHPPTDQPPHQPTTMSTQRGRFVFPQAESTVIPDPSRFFAPHLLSSPLPTNSFFQNFTLKNGDQPEYIHPYLVKSSGDSLSVSYPSRVSNTSFIYQVYNEDLTITTSGDQDDYEQDYPSGSHFITSFSDLSVTLEYPAKNIRFFLVRGSPYVTCAIRNTGILIRTIHAIIGFFGNSTGTKYTVKLNNGQTWLIYASKGIGLSNDSPSLITSKGSFSGVLRAVVLPGDGCEEILDRFSSCYPISGDALFTKPFSLEYKWKKKGWCDLLMLAHPLHLKLLSRDDCDATVLDDLKFRSIDGDLVGVVGDSWVLKTDPVSIAWHSIKGVKEESFDEIAQVLAKDVEDLNAEAISTTSSYFYGKLVARAARFALIAEEICFPHVIPKVRKYLKDTIEPWLDGSFNANGFLYDKKWGGLVTKQGAHDSGADFGFGLYNDHHYHLGYFLYGIAVLAKIDPAWGRKYRPQAYALLADFMNLGRRENPKYTRLRCFDLYKLHSWAGGLTEFADGRNQESTSEAVNAYYSAALMGLAYGDTHLIATGSTLAAFEIHAAQTWWQVKEGDNIYEEDFTRENRVVGVLWANKRDSALWFAPPDWRECRLGIQELPLLPITEVLFSDVDYVKQLVRWTFPALTRADVGEGWKGFVYALEGIYEKYDALDKIRNLNGQDDGNSLSNLLWWIHSRGDGNEEECDGGGRYSWFGHYCH